MPIKHPIVWPQILVSAIILSVSATAFYWISLRLVSQLHYYQAQNFLHKKRYGLAQSHLNRALLLQPADFRILKKLGEAYYESGNSKSSALEASVLIQEAKDYYARASRLNPADADALYGLARAEARLGRLHPYTGHDKEANPYDALPYFKQAIGLRPNALSFHYSLAQYLHERGRTEELSEAARSLACIYPPAYQYLSGKALWTSSAKQGFRQGLLDAIERDYLTREAHGVLSSLLAKEKDWDGAIAHYQESLKSKKSPDSASDYIRLGSLYLSGGQYQKAEANFLKGLKLSEAWEDDFHKVYGFFEKEGSVEEFYLFHLHVSSRFRLSPQQIVIFARFLFNLKEYNLAKRVLTELNEKEPYAEAYYWLARIAERLRDWDEMRRATREALSLEPDNAIFHAKAAEACERLGDRPQAISHYQKAMDLDPKNKRYKKRYLRLKAKGRKNKKR